MLEDKEFGDVVRHHEIMNELADDWIQLMQAEESEKLDSLLREYLEARMLQAYAKMQRLEDTARLLNYAFALTSDGVIHMVRLEN